MRSFVPILAVAASLQGGTAALPPAEHTTFQTFTLTPGHQCHQHQIDARVPGCYPHPTGVHPTGVFPTGTVPTGDFREPPAEEQGEVREEGEVQEEGENTKRGATTIPKNASLKDVIKVAKNIMPGNDKDLKRAVLTILNANLNKDIKIDGRPIKDVYKDVKNHQYDSQLSGNRKRGATSIPNKASLQDVIKAAKSIMPGNDKDVKKAVLTILNANLHKGKTVDGKPLEEVYKDIKNHQYDRQLSGNGKRGASDLPKDAKFKDVIKLAKATMPKKGGDLKKHVDMILNINLHKGKKVDGKKLEDVYKDFKNHQYDSEIYKNNKRAAFDLPKDSKFKDVVKMAKNSMPKKGGDLKKHVDMVLSVNLNKGKKVDGKKLEDVYKDFKNHQYDSEIYRNNKRAAFDLPKDSKFKDVIKMAKDGLPKKGGDLRGTVDMILNLNLGKGKKVEGKKLEDFYKDFRNHRYDTEFHKYSKRAAFDLPKDAKFKDVIKMAKDSMPKKGGDLRGTVDMILNLNLGKGKKVEGKKLEDFYKDFRNHRYDTEFHKYSKRGASDLPKDAKFKDVIKLAKATMPGQGGDLKQHVLMILNINLHKGKKVDGKPVETVYKDVKNNRYQDELRGKRDVEELEEEDEE